VSKPKPPPNRCLLCDRVTSPGKELCADCAHTMRQPTPLPGQPRKHGRPKGLS
jgi:hypothetical protein